MAISPSDLEQADREALLAEVRRLRAALEEAAVMWDNAAEEADRNYEPSTRVKWYRTQAAAVRALAGSQL